MKVMDFESIQLVAGGDEIYMPVDDFGSGGGGGGFSGPDYVDGNPMAPTTGPVDNDPNPAATAVATAQCAAGVATLAGGKVSWSTITSTVIACGTVFKGFAPSQVNDRYLPPHP